MDIAEYYFNLRPTPRPADNSDSDGQAVWKGLLNKGLQLKKTGGALRIVHNVPGGSFMDSDTKELAEKGAAQVRYY